MIAGRSRARPSPTTKPTRLVVIGEALSAEQVLDDALALLDRESPSRSASSAVRRCPRRCGRPGTARPRPCRGLPRPGRPRTAPWRRRRCGRCRHRESAPPDQFRPTCCDEAVDEGGGWCRGRGCARRPARPGRSRDRRPGPAASAMARSWAAAMSPGSRWRSSATSASARAHEIAAQLVGGLAGLLDDAVRLVAWRRPAGAGTRQDRLGLGLGRLGGVEVAADAVSCAGLIIFFTAGYGELRHERRRGRGTRAAPDQLVRRREDRVVAPRRRLLQPRARPTAPDRRRDAPGCVDR